MNDLELIEWVAEACVGDALPAGMSHGELFERLLALGAPVGQYTGRRHVDFGAAWDGPMVPPDQSVAGGKMVSVDDLVICEECLTFAAALVGLGDVSERDERIDRLNERLTATGQRLGKALEANEKLQAAFSAQEQVKRPPGRPRKSPE
jgi:hypothetical protein